MITSDLWGLLMKYKIGDLTKIRTGKLDANAATVDGIYPFFTCSKESLRISTYSYDCECVLVAGNGDLNVKYYNGKFDAYQRTYIIESNGNKNLYVPYLYYFMDKYVEELRIQAIGGVIKYIKLGNLTEAMIELPGIDRQREIVHILNKVKDVIECRITELRMLDELIKARFVEMFGDPLVNSKNLPTEQMGQRFNLKAGITTAAENIHDFEKGKFEVPCYGGNGIRGYVSEKSYSGTYPIIGRQGALCGNVQYATGDFHATEHAVLVSLLKDDNPIWVYYLLKLMDLYRFHTGAAQPGLAVKTLNTVDVIVVNKNLQTQFAIFVEQIDKSKVVGLKIVS